MPNGVSVPQFSFPRKHRPKVIVVFTTVGAGVGLLAYAWAYHIENGTINLVNESLKDEFLKQAQK